MMAPQGIASGGALVAPQGLVNTPVGSAVATSNWSPHRTMGASVSLTAPTVDGSLAASYAVPVATPATAENRHPSPRVVGNAPIQAAFTSPVVPEYVIR